VELQRSRRKWRTAGVLVLSAILFLRFGGIVDAGATSEVERGAAPAAAPGQGGGSSGAPWTLLVYQAADNDLEGPALKDMEEMMESAGPGVRIIAFIDRHPDYSSDPVAGLDDFEDAKIVEITSEGAQVLEEPGEVNSAHPQTLAWFVWYGLTNFPAERTGLILWNHGIGPVKVIGVDESSTMEGSPDILDLLEVQQALKSALRAADKEKLDLLAFDACLNGFFELARGMSPYAEYYVASEQLVQGDGYDYTGFAPLNDGTARDGRGLGQLILDSFPGHHNPLDPFAQAFTLSMIDLSTIDRLDAALGSFANVVAANPEVNGPALLQARAAATEFPEPGGGVNLVDLGDLLGRLPETSDPALLNARNAAYEALRNSVIANATGSAAGGATGLSIYLPSSGAEYLEDYGEIPDPGGWGRMLRTILLDPSSVPPEVVGGLDLEASGRGWKATLEAVDATTLGSAAALFGLPNGDGTTTQLVLLPASIGAGAVNNVQATWSYGYFTLDGEPVSATIQPATDGVYATLPGTHVSATAGEKEAALRLQIQVEDGRITEVGETALVTLDTAAAVIPVAAGDQFVPLRRIVDGVEPVGTEEASTIDLTDFRIAVEDVPSGEQFTAAIALRSPGGATTARSSTAPRP
jgi:hypothetical protein